LVVEVVVVFTEQCCSGTDESEGESHQLGTPGQVHSLAERDNS